MSLGPVVLSRNLSGSYVDPRDWHVSAAADLEFLCVLQVPESLEGQLLFHDEPLTHLVRASPDDGILFQASCILHRTTPISPKALSG